MLQELCQHVGWLYVTLPFCSQLQLKCSHGSIVLCSTYRLHPVTPYLLPRKEHSAYEQGGSYALRCLGDMPASTQRMCNRQK